MRHPFDGIVVPQKTESAQNRRSLLKSALAAVAGLFAWNRLQAKDIAVPILPAPPAPVLLTKAFPEAGGPVVGGVVGGGPNDPEPPDYRMSTAVRGEEGAGVTTTAPGEAGMPLTAAAFENGRIMTGALRERGVMTTLALGEEGGPATAALNEAGAVPALPVPVPAPIRRR